MRSQAGAGPEPITRRCSVLDWKELSSVFSACFPAANPDGISYQLRTYRKYIRIAEINGRIAGFTILIPHRESGIGWLEQIGISPDFRGRGLGKLLLEDFENSCLEQGMPRIELAVAPNNRAAIALYESAGYVAIVRPGEKRTYGKNLNGNPTAAPPESPRRPPTLNWMSRFASRIAYRLLVG